VQGCYWDEVSRKRVWKGEKMRGGAAKGVLHPKPGMKVVRVHPKMTLTLFTDFIVRRLQVVGPVEVGEMVVGPLKLPKDMPKEKRHVTKGKGKGKDVWAAKEAEEVDEEMAMCRQCILMKLMEKKIEVEILWKEINADGSTSWFKLWEHFCTL
jgi:hypothetical protein